MGDVLLSFCLLLLITLDPHKRKESFVFLQTIKQLGIYLGVVLFSHLTIGSFWKDGQQQMNQDGHFFV